MKWTSGALIALLVFALLGLWQFTAFQLRPVEDFYQPSGYIDRVNNMIHDGKLYCKRERTDEGYRPMIHPANFAAEDEAFYNKSWLRNDVEAFNSGNQDVFLLDKGRLSGINIYRHRVESPLSSDWTWWGKIYSQSAEGYAYLWNSRRTLKLYRPPAEERSSAKAAQSDFRDVIYGRGMLFQTGLGITLKGRSGNRIADVYSLGENIVLKSYGSDCCSINGHFISRGLEQRLEEGDLVQIRFEKTAKEEFLFHDFSQKPLSFVNVANGRILRTNLDSSFHMIDSLSDGIETAVHKVKKKTSFDVHLSLDEDLSGITQVALDNYVRQLSREPARASCTVMNAMNGQILAVASVTKNSLDANENLRLHPVGSATKILLAAAAAQKYPDLMDLEIDPHPNGEEYNLVGYPLKEGYKLGYHAPYPGEGGTVDFTTYLAKSCNRYHAILMALALARDSALASGKTENLFHGLALTEDDLDETNGRIYLQGDVLSKRPDLTYFLSTGNDGSLECNNLDSSELALNLERLFGVKRKYSEGSRDLFSPEPWNLLFARLGAEQNPVIYPAFYSIMPQTVNLGFNLNINFRQDFISIIFGGATNRWNNTKLAEAISRLVTNRKVQGHFVDRISEFGHDLAEQMPAEPLGIDKNVQQRLLQGMEAVCLPGGTAGDLYPILQDLKSRTDNKYELEFYAKTGTPFRKEIRKGEEEVYSSVLLFTAILRNRQSGEIQDGLSFSIYLEDLGEHKAVDFLKQSLGRILMARRWVN